MKKNLKRVLAVLLVGMLIFGMMPATLLARPARNIGIQPQSLSLFAELATGISNRLTNVYGYTFIWSNLGSTGFSAAIGGVSEANVADLMAHFGSLGFETDSYNLDAAWFHWQGSYLDGRIGASFQGDAGWFNINMSYQLDFNDLPADFNAFLQRIIGFMYNEFDIGLGNYSMNMWEGFYYAHVRFDLDDNNETEALVSYMLDSLGVSEVGNRLETGDGWFGLHLGSRFVIDLHACCCSLNIYLDRLPPRLTDWPRVNPALTNIVNETRSFITSEFSDAMLFSVQTEVCCCTPEPPEGVRVVFATYYGINRGGAEQIIEMLTNDFAVVGGYCCCHFCCCNDNGDGDRIYWEGSLLFGIEVSVRSGLGAGGMSAPLDSNIAPLSVDGFPMITVGFAIHEDLYNIHPTLLQWASTVAGVVMSEFDVYLDNHSVGNFIEFHTRFTDFERDDVSDLMARLVQLGFVEIYRYDESPDWFDATLFNPQTGVGVHVYHNTWSWNDPLSLDMWIVPPRPEWPAFHPTIDPWVNDTMNFIGQLPDAMIIYAPGDICWACCIDDIDYLEDFWARAVNISLDDTLSFISILEGRGFTESFGVSDDDSVEWEAGWHRVRAFVYSGQGIGMSAPLSANAQNRFATALSSADTQYAWFGFELQNCWCCDFCGDCFLECACGVPDDVDFFFTINYERETISFGESFEFARLNQTTREPILVGGERVMAYADRSQVSIIFNRNPDRINPQRGNWTSTRTGEIDISRNLRRDTYIGIRRTVRGQHELIAIVPITARPANRDIRVHRRTIYLPTMFANDAIVPGDLLRNPEAVGGETLEIRIGDDRRFFGTGRTLTSETLAPGQSFVMPHDYIPRGMRGIYRIAPQEATNFVQYEGEFTCVRTLMMRGYTSLPGYGNLQALLEQGSFASASIRFRIPNQPASPPIARMQMTPGRNGGAWFVARTNQHMRVNIGTETAPVWAPLTPSITLADLMALFPGGPTTLPRCWDNDDYLAFEVRIFRNNRVVSAPGFLRFDASEFAGNTLVTAQINPQVITGTQGVNNANGTNITITTRGGRITHPTGARGTAAANVSSWFGASLPAGLTATLTRVSGAQATINIHGTPTAIANNTAMVINIPATAIEGGAAVNATNALVGGGGADQFFSVARFNISAAPAGSDMPPDDIPMMPEMQEVSEMQEMPEMPPEVGFEPDAYDYAYGYAYDYAYGPAAVEPEDVPEYAPVYTYDE